jgi:hypothetical protein
MESWSLGMKKLSNDFLVTNEGFRLTGKCRLRAFDRGVIPTLLDQGWSMEEAVDIATDAGRCHHDETVENMVVTTGKRLVGDLMAGIVTVGVTYHAIGTGTDAAALTDIKLKTEYARKLCDSRVRAGNIVSFWSYYLASACTIFIKEAGYFGNAATAAADSGTLFSHFLQSYDNSAGLYDLTFQYSVEVSS